MKLKKWTSTLTLCALTMMMSVSPALAEDTGDVSNPNLYAVAQAMNAAQVNPPTTNTPSTGTNTSQAVSTDYITLTSPAVSDSDGKIYLPLRSTFTSLKTQALAVEWKPGGQEKIQLTGSQGDFEVYLVNGDTGVQITKGGTTYTLLDNNGVKYAPMDFFQAILGSANIGVSDTILVLTAKDGGDLWSNKNFWNGMNTYKEEVTVTPSKPEVTKPEVTIPEVNKPTETPSTTPTTPTKPEITHPEVTTPTTPSTGGNSGTTGGSTSGGTSGGSSSTASGSVVPIKVVSGGNGLIADALFWPTSVTYVSSPYAYRSDPFGGLIGDFHLGVDIAGPTGTPIYAAQGGTVIRASWFDSYGNCIDIQHPSGLVTRYAHLSAYNVSVGDTVSQGQVIAAMGATGNVTGAHLHFETRINGQTVDPGNYLNLNLV